MTAADGRHDLVRPQHGSGSHFFNPACQFVTTVSGGTAGRKEEAAITQELRAALMEWMVTERDYLPLPIASDPPDLR